LRVSESARCWKVYALQVLERRRLDCKRRSCTRWEITSRM